MPENEQTQNPLPEEGQQEEKSTGPLVGIIIVVVVLVFGGLYFWGKQVSENSQIELEELPSASEITNTPDETLETLGTQGTSDEVGAIESDLNSTNLDNLDTEFGNIDDEFGQIEILGVE